MSELVRVPRGEDAAVSGQWSPGRDARLGLKN